jgi:hypothetical protein
LTTLFIWIVVVETTSFNRIISFEIFQRSTRKEFAIDVLGTPGLRERTDGFCKCKKYRWVDPNTKFCNLTFGCAVRLIMNAVNLVIIIKFVSLVNVSVNRIITWREKTSFVFFIIVQTVMSVENLMKIEFFSMVAAFVIL